MLVLILKRLLLALPTLAGIVLVTFMLTRMLPGDPAAYFAGNAASVEAVEQIRAKLGLNQPLPTQFMRYLRDLATGDWGQSLSTGQPVAYEIATRLPASLELTLVALVLSLMVSIPLGVLAATRPGSWIDQLCRLVTTAGVSLPVFFTGLLLSFFFYFLLGWAPSPLGRIDPYVSAPTTLTGFYLIDSLVTGNLEAFKSSLKQLILPAVTLALFVMAPVARMTRASMLGVLSADYVRTARAMGLSRAKVLYGYAFHNAFLPVLTTIGMVFSFMLGANVLVEKVFAWPGIGSFAVESLVASDYAPVQGFVLTMAVMYVALNLVIDLLYLAIDPRVSVEGVEMADAGMRSHIRHVLGENPVTALAFALFTAFVLLAIAGPWLAPYDPLATNAGEALKPPSMRHWFGTDALGRDVLSRVMVAARIDFGIALSAVAISSVLGILLGMIAGYHGGWFDRVVGRVVDTIMAFPLFVLAMGIVAAMGNTVANIVLATAIINLPFYVRVARAETNVRRDAGFIEAARITGNSTVRLLGFHMLPNILPPAMVQISLNMGLAILNCAGLSFIGLGVRPPQPEWGIMVAEGAQYIVSGEWWVALFPGAVLMLAVFCFNLLGDGLRDIIDPRRRT